MGKGALLGVLLFVAAVAFFPAPVEAAPHGPINIDGDGDFTAANGVVRGSGTSTDPYVIEGWEFSTNSSVAIRIKNTEAHVVFQNLLIHGNWRPPYPASGFSAIFIGDTPDAGSSNITVRDVRMTAVGAGVALIRSSNILIDNVSIVDAETSIVLRGASNVVIQNSFIKNSTNPASIVGGEGILFRDQASSNVTVRWNAFLENEYQVRFFNTFFIAKWDSDGRGNFWSDHMSVDADFDGVYDTPYAIDPREIANQTNTDDFPLVAPPSEAAPHAAISIQSDADFTAANGVVRGTGTSTDPYVIEGWELSANASIAVDIRNTAAHVLLENLTIYGDFQPPFAGKTGWAALWLESTSHITVRNIRAQTVAAGLVVTGTSDLTVDGMTILDAETGIAFRNSLDIVVQNSLVQNSTQQRGPTAFGGEALFFIGGSTTNLTVRWNDFIDNNPQVRFRDGSFQVAWDSDGRGNHWSDHTGVDADFDGDFDTPYVIDLNNQDNFPIFYDFEAPVSTASTLGTQGSGGWWRSDISVSLSASDNTGVLDIFYRIDGGVWTSYTSPFMVAGDGLHLVEHYSLDHYVNAEEVQGLAINIDGQSPSSSFALSGVSGLNGWFVSDVTVSLSASDGLSGVQDIQYRFGAFPFLPYQGPFTLKDGTHEIDHFAVDAAGNREPTQQFIVSIDSVAPEVLITEPLTKSTIRSSSVTIVGSALDSNIAQVELRVDNGSWFDVGETNLWSFTLTLSNGDHWIEARATDIAGNFATDSILIAVSASSPPSVGDQPASEFSWVLVGIVGLVAAGATGLLLYLRRRRSA